MKTHTLILIPAEAADGDKLAQIRRPVTKANSDVGCVPWGRLEFGEIPADAPLKLFADNGYLHVPCRPHPDDPQTGEWWTRERVYPKWEPGDVLLGKGCRYDVLAVRCEQVDGKWEWVAEVKPITWGGVK